MIHQLNIFLLLFGGLQGLLISIFLLRRKPRNGTSIYLTMLLMLVGLQLTFKVLSKAWLMDNVQLLYNISYHLPLLAGPLLYFLVRSRTSNARWTIRDFLHFVPFILFFLYGVMVTYTGFLFTTMFDRWLMQAYPKGVVQLVVLFLYVSACWTSARTLKEENRKQLQQFIVVLGVAEGLIIIAIALLQRFYGQFPDIRLVFVSLTVVIYWISYKLYSRPTLFTLVGSGDADMKLEAQAKYAHSGLKQEDTDRIATLLRDAMGKQKLFLQADLSIDRLSSTLQISRHHISQVLNETFKQSYFDFINTYRLEDACGRLADPKCHHFTIAAIALDAGFSSVSNFNEVFKKRHGCTPSRFREQHAKKMSA